MKSFIRKAPEIKLYGDGVSHAISEQSIPLILIQYIIKVKLSCREMQVKFEFS